MENEDEDYFRCSSCGRVLHKRLLKSTYEDEPICEDCNWIPEDDLIPKEET